MNLNKVLGDILHTYDRKSLANYLCFHFIIDRLRYLDERIEAPTKKFHNDVFSKLNIYIPDEKNTPIKTIQNKFLSVNEQIFYRTYLNVEFDEHMVELVDKVHVRFY